MRQSLSIIKQAMRNMPDGEIAANVRRIARPPKGEVYIRTESPRGDFGVFLVSDGSDKPYRVKARAPSFCNLQALQAMLTDAYIADAVIILGSIDIVLGEVDRVSLSQTIYYTLGGVALLIFLAAIVLILTWAERKALARIQMRMGPMRVGFHGTLQPIADSIKLFTKEDILPSWADRRIYWIAPVAVFIPSFMLWVTLPVARDVVLRNLDLGLFYITAISVLSVMGLIMAGWGVGEQVRDSGRPARGGPACKL